MKESPAGDRGTNPGGTGSNPLTCGYYQVRGWRPRPPADPGAAGRR
jgi:hypothetical protein